MTSGYGRYIPCGLCGSSGVCSLCRGSGRCVCTAASEYPGYVIGSTSAITPDGTTIRNTAGYNGRDDKFVITPPGGTSYTLMMNVLLVVVRLVVARRVLVANAMVQNTILRLCNMLLHLPQAFVHHIIVN